MKQRELIFYLILGKLKKAKIFNFDKEGNVTIKNKEYTDFISFYNVDKLNNLFKNLDTISFFELISENKNLIPKKEATKKTIISEKINSFFALPFFSL